MFDRPFFLFGFILGGVWRDVLLLLLQHRVKDARYLMGRGAYSGENDHSFRAMPITQTG